MNDDALPPGVFPIRSDEKELLALEQDVMDELDAQDRAWEEGPEPAIPNDLVRDELTGATDPSAPTCLDQYRRRGR